MKTLTTFILGLLASAMVAVFTRIMQAEFDKIKAIQIMMEEGWSLSQSYAIINKMEDILNTD